MARIFNVEVFNKTISGGGSPPEYFTGQEFYGLLGSADKFVAQVIVDAIKADPTTVTVAYWVNNGTDEANWADTMTAVTVTTAGFTDLPIQGLLVWTDPNGCYGRFVVTSDTPGATVRIIVCGRSSG